MRGVSPRFAHFIRQTPCVEYHRDRSGFEPARGHNDLAWQASFPGWGGLCIVLISDSPRNLRYKHPHSQMRMLYASFY